MSPTGGNDAFGQGDCQGPCDPEKVFDLAEGLLEPEQGRETREHLVSCPGCRELYERELELNACLSSLDFSGIRSRSVCQSVTMALPTRPKEMRLLWGALAAALFVAALVTLELNGAEPVLFGMSALGVLWGWILGSADAARAVFAATDSTILPLLALGALLDALIALTVITVSRGRRAREA